MYAIRIVGTNDWILRTPGHSKVVSGAGSTWAKPPTNIEYFYNTGVEDHIVRIMGLNPSKNKSLETASRDFYKNPSKYLEVVKIEFKEVP